jgi:hypothetical protein
MLSPLKHSIDFMSRVFDFRYATEHNQQFRYNKTNSEIIDMMFDDSCEFFSLFIRPSFPQTRRSFKTACMDMDNDMVDKTFTNTVVRQSFDELSPLFVPSTTYFIHQINANFVIIPLSTVYIVVPGVHVVGELNYGYEPEEKVSLLSVSDAEVNMVVHNFDSLSRVAVTSKRSLRRLNSQHGIESPFDLVEVPFDKLSGVSDFISYGGPNQLTVSGTTPLVPFSVVDRSVWGIESKLETIVSNVFPIWTDNLLKRTFRDLTLFEEQSELFTLSNGYDDISIDKIFYFTTAYN